MAATASSSLLPLERSLAAGWAALEAERARRAQPQGGAKAIRAWELPERPSSSSSSRGQLRPASSAASDAQALAAADKEAILAAVAALRADIGKSQGDKASSSAATTPQLKPSASAARASRLRAEAQAIDSARAAELRDARSAAAAAVSERERTEGELLSSRQAQGRLETQVREAQVALADAEHELMAQDLTVAQLRNELRQTHEAAAACEAERDELRRRLQRRAAVLAPEAYDIGSGSPLGSGGGGGARAAGPRSAAAAARREALRRVASAERRLVLSERGGAQESESLRHAYAALHEHASERLADLTSSLVEAATREAELRAGMVEAGTMLLQTHRALQTTTPDEPTPAPPRRHRGAARVARV